MIIYQKFDLGDEAWGVLDDYVVDTGKVSGCSFCDFQKVIVLKDSEFPCPACQFNNTYINRWKVVKGTVCTISVPTMRNPDDITYTIEVSEGDFEDLSGAFLFKTEEEVMAKKAELETEVRQ